MSESARFFKKNSLSMSLNALEIVCNYVLDATCIAVSAVNYTTMCDPYQSECLCEPPDHIIACILRLHPSLHLTPYNPSYESNIAVCEADDKQYFR